MTLHQIDAFTDSPFAGNPAAVTLLDDWPDADRMQRIAAEMNLSETAFLVPEDEGFGLHWFTPETEVDLCGHATLAAAHFLWEQQHLVPDETARFATKSGLLSARKGTDGWIWMDFPAEPVRETSPPEGLGEALGAAPSFVGRNRMDVLALLDNEAAVRELAPDLTQLAAIDARGVIVTAQAAGDADYDFVSRFFAPAVGVPEDPVTGSAHCALAPFWAGRLEGSDLTGRQVSRRGGTVRIQADDERVRLGGQAVTVLDANLRIESS